jgi:hypothetical protein
MADAHHLVGRLTGAGYPHPSEPLREEPSSAIAAATRPCGGELLALGGRVAGVNLALQEYSALITPITRTG